MAFDFSSAEVIDEPPQAKASPTPVTFYSIGKSVGGADETEDRWTNQGYSAKGRNLTPGVVAVNPKKYPLGTVLRNPENGEAFLATDLHGNADPNVVDIYLPPGNYKAEKRQMEFEVVDRVKNIPTTAAGVRDLLSRYGKVPEGESAEESLAAIKDGLPPASTQSAQKPEPVEAHSAFDWSTVDVIEPDAPQGGGSAAGFDWGSAEEVKPAGKSRIAETAGDVWNQFWGKVADGSLMFPQGIYRQAAETVRNVPDNVFLDKKEQTEWETLNAKRIRLESEQQYLTEGGHADPELDSELAGVRTKMAGLETKGGEIKANSTLGVAAAEYNQLADNFDEIRDEYAQVYDVSPEFQNRFMGQLIGAAGGLVPQLVASQLPGVGLAALQSQSFQNSWDDAKASAERQDKPFVPEQAYAYALTNSFQEALLEKVGFDAALGKLFKAGEQKTIKELGKRVVIGLLGEGGTEALQGANQDTLATLTGVEKRNPLDPNSRFTEFAIGGILGGGLAGVHSGGEMLLERGAEGGEVQASGQEIDLSNLEGATSQEQFENLQRKAGNDVDAVAPTPEEDFAPKDPVEEVVTEEADPFAIEGEGDFDWSTAQEYVPGDDTEIEAEAQRQAEEAARYRQEMEQEIADTIRAEREASGSMELLQAIEEAGGLPTRGSQYYAPYEGELKTVREGFKADKALKLFRKDAPDPDTLVTSLRDRGFAIEGPNQLWDLLDARIQGRETWSEPQRQDDYWSERQGLMGEDAAPVEADPFKTTPEARKQWMDGLDTIANTASGAPPASLPQTPEVLRRVGLANLPISLRPETLAKVTKGKHALQLGQLKMLPRELSDPLMVFKSDSPETPNSLVVVTNMRDRDNPVLAVIHPNRREQNHSVHVIASAYGKTGWQHVFDQWADNGRLLYANTTAKNPFLRSSKLQSLLEVEKGGSKVITQEDIVKAPQPPKAGEAFTPAQTAERGDLAAENLGTAPVVSVNRELEGTPGDEFSAQEKVIAMGWRREMRHKGKVDFIGRTIKDGYDLAMAAQVYRDPRFETIRWLFVKDGKVVDTAPITSKNPRFTMALLPGKGVQQMVELARATGADGIWLQHNHPSGDPQPSESLDIPMTKTIAAAAAKAGVNFMGHIVINGGRFAEIRGDGTYEIRTMPGKDELLQPEYEHELLGRKVAGPKSAQAAAEVWARLAADQRDGDGQVALFLLDTQRKIRTITTIPAELFLDRKKFPEYLHARGSAYGVSFAVAYYDAPEHRSHVADAMGEYVRGAVIEDGLLSPREAIWAEHGVRPQVSGDRYFGEEVNGLARRTAVREDAADIEAAGGRLADEAMKDGPLRVMSSDGKNIFASVPLTGLADIKIIEMPEMLALTKELMGSTPELRRMRAAAGKMFPQGNGRIQLDPRIFADSTVAAKVFAHELGHLADYLPDKTLKRGNIIGRIYSLKNHMKGRAFGSKTGVEEAKLREELVGLTKYWAPWDEATAPKWYTDYRKSSVELYADAISVLFNSPATLKQKAPTFYREFFAWLDSKPEVKTEFFTLQAMLNKPAMELLTARSQAVRGMFGKAEEVFIQHRQKKEAQHMTARGWIDLMREQLYDRYDPIIRRQRKVEKEGKTVPDALRMDYLFDEHPLADNLTFTWLDRMWKNVVKPLEAAEISMEDLGEYLMFSRIMNDRAGVANPLGHTPRTAQAGLLRMRLDMGIEKFTLLESGAAQFHEYVYDTVREAVQAGIISKEVFEKSIEPNKATYAAFRPIDYVEDYVPAGVYQQIGTLKEIENPWLTTILKSIAMRRAIQHQRAKAGAVAFLQEFFPEEIQPAETRFDGKRQVAKPPKDKEKGLMEIRTDGEWKGYVVPAEVARMFDQVDPAQANAVMRILNWVFRKGFYNLWVRFNPVFQLAFSPMRDAQRFYVNMPKAGAVKLATTYIKSLPAAVRRLMGNTDPIVMEMYETLALGTPHDSFARSELREDAFEEILRQFHLVPEAEKPGWRQNKIVKGAESLLKSIEFAGQIFEAAPKIAGYKILTRELGMAPRDAAHYIRNYIGVPNYLRRGKHATAAGTLFPFWNVAIQGIASDSALMAGKEAKASTGSVWARKGAGWWVRWALAGGGFAIISALARIGLLGDEAEEWYAGVSDYDYANFMIIPLGTMPGGDFGRKVMYIKVPQDEMHRITNGVLKKFIESIGRQAKGEATKPLMNDLMELAGYSGGQLPGVNPAVGIAAKWKAYMDGQNPWDPFRGRNILTNAQYLSGGWESIKPMLSMTWNEAGLGNFYRYNPEADTTTEMVVSNLPIVQRLVKVSDRGYAERQQNVIEKDDSQDARLRLKMPENVQRLSQEYNFLRGLGKSQRTPIQQMRYEELGAWNRTIYTPYYEAGQAAMDAGIKPDLSGLGPASAAWE